MGHECFTMETVIGFVAMAYAVGGVFGFLFAAILAGTPRDDRP